MSKTIKSVLEELLTHNFEDNSPEYSKKIFDQALQDIKSIIEMEVIGEDASMGRDALTYDEKEHINQWLNEQRTNLNKLLG